VLEWISSHYNNNEDEFIFRHFLRTRISEYVLKMVIEGQINHVTINEWDAALKHFRACYPFTLEGYKAA